MKLKKNQEVFISESKEDLAEAAEILFEFAGDQTVFVFFAPMGAGKTTFIKEICRTMGVNDKVASPSYNLVNEYYDAESRPVYHFDFYRIKDISEAEDLGFYEYLDSGKPCLIEWGEKIVPILGEEPYISIKIEVQNKKRIITFDKVNEQ